MKSFFQQKKTWAITTAIVLFIIAVVLYAVCTPKKLYLYNADTSERYREWNIYEGMEFSVEFIHSVNKSPVCDIFVIQDGVIHAKATSYSAFGAGVQTEIEDGQTLTFDENGDMIVSGFTFTYDRLNYIVGTVSDHVLEIEGEKISLRNLCGRNAAVVFEIK